VDAEEGQDAGPCAELIGALEAGGEAAAGAVRAVRGEVLQYAFAADGCRAVQLALQVADRESLQLMLQGLRGHVREAIASPHANYVIQKIVEVVPTAQSSFIAEELWGMAAAAARHRYGCRVLCRLFEHSTAGASAGLLGLLEELVAQAAELSRHCFAHYVLESVLEHGPAEARRQIAAALCIDLQRNAQHRCASHVVEAALQHCDEEDKSYIVAGLVGAGSEAVLALALTQFGSFVVRALLKMPSPTSDEVLGHVRRCVPRLQQSKYGQRLLQDVGAAPPAAAAAGA